MPQLMHTVEDGIITGNIERNRQQCLHCGSYTMVINIQHFLLPQGIEPSERIILVKVSNKYPKCKPHIGIGCGCYAKAHRQLAHIQSRIDQRTDLENVL